MATINGLTKERMLEIMNGVIESAAIVGGHLIFTKHDTSTLDVGVVEGPTGSTGATGPAGPTNPAGMVTQFAGSSAPSGYLLCDGSAVSRSTYAALFAAIATSYGVGDGSTTFNLPDLKGKVPVGFNSGETEFNTLGETGGAKTVSLASGDIPSHTHASGTLATASAGAHTHTLAEGVISPNAFADGPSPAGSTAIGFAGPVTTSSDGAHTHGVTGSTAATGSGTAHQNLQPYVVLNYIIKT